MKKFLTVLLVIAVMFTFSFGSAFADTSTAVPESGSYLAKLTAAESSMVKELESWKAAVVANLANNYTMSVGTTPKTITVPKSVYTAVADKVYSDLRNVINNAVATKKAAYEAMSAADKATADAQTAATVLSDAEAVDITVTGEWYSGKDWDDIQQISFQSLVLGNDTQDAGSPAYLEDIYVGAYSAVLDYVVGEYNKVDLSAYSDDVMTAKDAYKTTYAKFAADEKDRIIAEIKTKTFASADDNAKKADVLAAIQSYMDGLKADTTALDGTVVTYVFMPNTLFLDIDRDGVYDAADGDTYLVTKDSYGTGATTLAAKKAETIAEINSAAAKFYADAVTAYNTAMASATTYAQKVAAKDALDKATAEKDAFVEVETYNTNEMTSAASLPAAGTYTTNFVYANYAAKTGWFVNPNTPFTNRVDLYEQVEAYVAEQKLAVEKDGTLKYDSTKLDKNLADAKKTIFGGNPYTVANVVIGADIPDDLAWEQQKAVAQLEDERDTKLYNKDGSDKYYEVEKNKLIAKYDEAIAKVNAATTVKQVKQLPTTLSTSTITEKAATRTAIKGLTSFAKEWGKIQNYLGSLNYGLNSWNDNYRTYTQDDLAAFYAAKGARTNAEIEALLAEAKADVDATATKKANDETQKAIEKMVADLPNALTLADKAAVEAAWTALDDFGGSINNQARLDSAVAVVQSAERKAIDKMFADLPSLSKLTLANKDAVAAAKDAIKAYNSTMMYNDTYDKTELTKYQNQIRDLEKASVAAQIAALSADATKAQVEAARAAYDAFVEEYTNALTGYDARRVINIDKLLYAEASLANNLVSDVQALKITASSTVKKGSITVKWKVEGNAAAADGYQIYRSVKKNSGFGTKPIFTTAKQTYKNTKGLKKGTRYYYKVRAYKVVDGKKIYSDWSNKAYRVAK